MRAAFVLALFLGLIVTIDGARQTADACENATDCDSAKSEQVAELAAMQAAPCASDSGAPCASSSRIDDAISSILCGNSLDARDCSSGKGAANDLPNATSAPKPQGQTLSTGLFGQEDDGC